MERRLKVIDVVEQFDCSNKTAKQDLRALKEDGKIEFVGNSRIGSYRLKPPAPQP
jgi:DeoR/GlpR family transcriptional regulator of sugar metabolism